MQAGRFGVARSGLEALEPQLAAEPEALLAVAECWTHMGRHEAAERACRAAAAAAPDSPQCLYALASSLVATGKAEEAEALYTRVIALMPCDWDAWANRSTLRRATAAQNHVDALSAALDANRADDHARVALGYALAKELEDLGDYDAAFTRLADAARARRARLSYRVEDDVETMAHLARAFDADRLKGAPPADAGPGPIFVLGLPRSGTTLVDRILSSHPEVASLGELQDFALALMGLLHGVRGKADLIARSVTMDHRALGRDYLRRIAGYEPGRPFATDKAPLNFLYIGLIALGLPEARIVHVRRGAMDSCYAMFKTLFRMGFPFSYDLSDLARYRIAYERLMAHWRALLPGRLIEIDYELLVRDQEGESRRLVAALGLPWDDACLTFHRNAAPVATASAVQVRQPIHDRSVGLWRRYEAGLAPLAEALSSAGIALECEAAR